MPEPAARPGAASLRPYLLVLGAATCWGTIGVAYALIDARLTISAITVVFIRAASAFTALLVYALLARRDLLRVRPRDLPYLALFGFVTVTCFYVVLIYTFQFAGVALGTVLLYLAPAFVTFASVLFLGEAFTRRKGLALALCLLGAVLVVRPWQGGGWRANGAGIVLGLLSAIAYGSYSLLGKPALRRHQPLTLMLYGLGFGLLGLTPLQIAAGSPLPGGVALLVLVLVTGVAITLVPLSLYTTALRDLPPSVASIVATFEPVVAIVLAALVLGQVLTAVQLGGAALIISGVVVLAGGERARRLVER